MDGGHLFSGADGEDVVVRPGEVTSISDTLTDAVAAGGTSIAASLTSDPDLLNIAFVAASGEMQFVQIRLDDLLPGGAPATGADVVVNAELTALSADAISNGEGTATPVGTVAVAATLGAQGDLTLSFVDGNSDLQLIETNVAELLQSLPAADAGPADSVEPGSGDAAS